MDSLNVFNSGEKGKIGERKNDVVPSNQLTMGTTEVPSGLVLNRADANEIVRNQNRISDTARFDTNSKTTLILGSGRSVEAISTVCERDTEGETIDVSGTDHRQQLEKEYKMDSGSSGGGGCGIKAINCESRINEGGEVNVAHKEVAADDRTLRENGFLGDVNLIQNSNFQRSTVEDSSSGGGDGVVGDSGATKSIVMNKSDNTVISESANGSIDIIRKERNKAKRRRRKSKMKSNGKPYRKTNWKFQMPRSRYRDGKGSDCPSLVPYNTNRFLMEEHMPEFQAIQLTPSRTRDSSFSADSEDYFNSLPEDEEEFLTKEFSSCYEDARTERMNEMSKTQLIDEYLQLESNFNKLSRDYNRLVGSERSNEAAKERQQQIEFQNRIRILEDKIKELNADNLGECTRI